jgi:hypothetical protein
MVLFCNALRQRLSFQPVMRGQKRVDDARERAYDPRIHLHEDGWIAGSSPAMTSMA